MKRPNFLFVCTDQQQAEDAGALGNRVVQTPNLDRLIGEGVVMRNSFAAHPVCTPARCAMLTGRYSSNLGCISDSRTNPHRGMPLETNTFPRELRRAGYQTAGMGKFHLNACEIWGREDNVPTSEYARRGRVLPENYFGFEHVRLGARHREVMNWAHSEDIRRHAPEVFALAGPGSALAEPSGAWQSWKSAVPERWYSTTWITDQVIDFLTTRRRADAPFCVWCSYPDPHHPMAPPAPWGDMYDPADVPLPRRREAELADVPAWTAPFMPVGRTRVTGAPHPPAAEGFVLPDEHVREIRALTYGMISLIDKSVGRVVETLRRTGELDDTVICFLCDHGDYLGDHWLVGKGPLHYDSLIRVPNFWWAPPGMFEAGRVCEALISHVDLCPTVLELAQVERPWNVQGRSLAGVLTGAETDVRDAVLIEDDGWHLPYMPRTIRTKDYRLTRWISRREGVVLDEGELFDLREDPHELTNRFGDPALAATRGELTERLLALQVEATSFR